MTPIPGRPRAQARQLPALLALAGLATLGALAVFAASRPMMVLAAPLGVFGVWFAAQRPVLALVLMIVVEVSNVSGVLALHVRLPLFQAVLGLGVIALVSALRDRDARGRLNGWTVIAALLLGCYLSTQVLAALGSTDVGASITTLERAVVDSAFLMIVVMLMQVTGKAWTAAAAFVIPLALMSFLTLVNQMGFAGTNSFGGFATVTIASGEAITTLRYGGPLPDPNFWGRHLVMGLPLAGALLVRACRADSRRVMIGWASAALAILAGIYLTQSRGTFPAAVVAAAVWAIASGRSGRRWGMAVAPLLVLGALVTPGIGNRLIAAATQMNAVDVNNASVDPSILGRMASQEMSAMMFHQRPLFGYGPGTFVLHVEEFAGQVPTAVRALAPERLPIEAPHNIYLGMAAESGVIGVAGWTLMVCGFVAIVLLRIVAEPRSPDRVLAAAVIAAIVAWSAASVGLHLAFFRTFGLVLMMAVAVAPQWPPPPWAVRLQWRRIAGVVLLVSLAGAVGWLLTSSLSTPVVTASQRLTVIPRGDVDGYYAWALDIRSRTAILPTFGRVMASPGVEVTADSLRGVLTVSATAGDERQARSVVTAGVDQARRQFSEVLGDNQFRMIELGDVNTRTEDEAGTGALVAGVIAALVTALPTGLALRRPLRHPRLRPVAGSQVRQEVSV